MTRELPDWQPFSPDADGDTPSELSEGRGRALVLLASPRTEASGWATTATAGIARRASRSRSRVLVADLDLESPRLHDEFGVPNGEGMSDVLRFGAGLRRVARTVDSGLRFIPAGTAVADPEPALESPRLRILVENLREADAEILLHLPLGAPGRDAVLEHAPDVVLLAEAGEVDSLVLPEVEGLRVHAVLGPEEEVAPVAAGAPEAENDDEAPRGTAAAAAAALGPAGGAGGAPAGARSRRTVALLAAFVVVAAAVVGAALLGYLTVPGIPPTLAADGAGAARDVAPAPGEGSADGGDVATSEEEAGEPAAPDGGAPPGEERAAPASPPPVHRLGMGVGSYEELERAMERAEALSADARDVGVVVAPVEVDGSTWYRLVASPLPEGMSGAELREWVADALGVGDPSSWFMRFTPVAFALGDHSNLDAARRRVAELRQDGVPAYVLEVDDPEDGSPLYRVYAGAFSGAEEAAHLGAVIERLGLTDASLVSRTGRLPARRSSAPE